MIVFCATIKANKESAMKFLGWALVIFGILDFGAGLAGYGAGAFVGTVLFGGIGIYLIDKSKRTDSKQ